MNAIDGISEYRFFFFAEDFTEKLADFQTTEILQFIIASLLTSNQRYGEPIEEAKFVVALHHLLCPSGHFFLATPTCSASCCFCEP